MKDLFKGKTFNEEPEFWGYLLTLKEQTFAAADGYYLYQGGRTDGTLSLETLHFFSNYEKYSVDSRDIAFSMLEVTLTIQEGRLTQIHILAPGYCINEDRVHGDWKQTFFKDSFLDNSDLPKKFSKEDLQKSCESLVKTLIVHGKKIS